MVFDRRFNAASPRYLGSASNAQQQKRWAPPAALGLLRPLDPVLLNGVRRRPETLGLPRNQTALQHYPAPATFIA